MSTMYTFRPVRLPVQDSSTNRMKPKQGARGRRTSTNRVLFSPVDHGDLNAFLDREFQKQATIECQRWDFDFAKGEPLAEARQYEWHPFTSTTGLCPPSPPRKRTPIPINDISELYAQPIAIDERPTPISANELDIDLEEEVFATPSNPIQSTPLKKTPVKQSKITDYLQSRKRMFNSNSTTKKDVESSGLTKMARITFSKS